MMARLKPCPAQKKSMVGFPDIPSPTTDRSLDS